MQRTNRRPQGGSNSFRRLMRRRPKPLWLVIALHVLALGAALLVYAVPHHVMPRQQEAIGLKSSREAVSASVGTQAPTQSPAQTPAPTASLGDMLGGVNPSAPLPTEAPAATIEPADGVGQFRVKFEDKFTSGAVEVTDSGYRSGNISVSFSTIRYKDSNVNVADIYVADISSFITAFGSDEYKSGSRYAEKPAVMAERYGAVVTLSGDYFGMRDGGVVIRNGTLYRDEKITGDVCVLYWDGSVKCFSPDEFDARTEMAAGAYQAWNFGPMLLDANGMSMTSFNTDVGPKNPRAIFGYYEPGHYCFISVDGRSDESEGLTMTDCSALMAEAGLAQAYNLDGGQTAAMVRGTELVGVPYKGGRKVSDVLMIIDGTN